MNLDKLRFADGSVRTSELRLSMQKVGADAVTATLRGCLHLTAGGPVPHLAKQSMEVMGSLSCRSVSFSVEHCSS